MSRLLKEILVIFIFLLGFSVQGDKEKKEIEPIKIVIQSNDLMQYDKNAISAEKGKKYFSPKEQTAAS